MRCAILFALLLTACAGVGPVQKPGVQSTAYPFDRDDLERADVRACFEALARPAMAARSPYERAAFLVLQPSGTFACSMWPRSFGYMKEEWRGAVPDGTVAIVHTHPRALPLPSTGDLDQSERTQLPIFVLTAEGVSLADPVRGSRVMAQRDYWR